MIMNNPLAVLVSVGKEKDSVHHQQGGIVGQHPEHGQQPGVDQVQGVCWMMWSL